MMGSWKSTAGRKLADHMDWDHVDTDDEIRENLKMSIREVFRYLGEDRFRTEESSILKHLSLETETIVSTGGGIVLDAGNRQILREKGYTILLKAKPETLAGRIQKTSHRPLLKNDTNVFNDLQKLWETRAAFYEDCAHFTLITDDLDSNQVVTAIRKHLTEINAANQG